MSVLFECNKKRIYLEEGDSFYSHTENVYREASAGFINTLVEEVKLGKPWRSVIEEKVKPTDPWLAKIILGAERNKFLELIPEFRKDSVALDIGAGWGQHTVNIAQKAKVCCIEPSPERFEFIKQITQQENCSSNCYYINAQLGSLELERAFDFAVCIGVLEWVGRFEEGDKPEDTQLFFLKKIKGALKTNSPLIVGIENRIGLKYLLGSKDDHIGIPYITCCEYDDASRIWTNRGESNLEVATYDIEQYKDLFKKAGFDKITVYAAFPDYKLPQEIIQCYPKDKVTQFFKSGEFLDEHEGNDGTNFIRNDVLKSVYKTLTRLEIIKYFVPSFFIIAR